MLKPGEIVEFDRKKLFKYIRPLGEGGTGDTHLFEDETTDMLFAFKKYVPKNSDFIDEYYIRFVDEIKILFGISHQYSKKDIIQMVKQKKPEEEMNWYKFKEIFSEESGAVVPHAENCAGVTGKW